MAKKTFSLKCMVGAIGMKPQCIACFYGPGVWFGLIGSGAGLLKEGSVLFV
jgi:hypothetical protein